MEVAAVLDVGKTNLKLLAIDRAGTVLDAIMRPNASIPGPPYLHVDLAGIESWLLEALAEMGRRHRIGAIVASAYGSSGVLVDERGPVLPMIDYEIDCPAWLDEAYAAEEPSFAETLCATGAGMQRLTKQLLWLRHEWPEAFGRARHVLGGGQYWAWRLSGVAASEYTTLGAQTHFWNPPVRDFTGIVKRHGWDRLVPPRAPAWAPLGPIRPEIARRTGLSPTVEILCGIHDSNANWYRYRAAGLSEIALLSTGTWIIGFNPAFPVDRMDPARGMVGNTDVDGNPIACTLTMTGREYAVLAEDARSIPDERAIAGVIADGTLALPSFVSSDGAFPASGGRGRIVGPAPRDRPALAVLYAAFSALTCLEALEAPAEIVVDGGFSTNRPFAALIAALRPRSRVRVSTARDGTAVGAALLWGHATRREPVPIALETVAPADIPGLHAYAARWRQAVAAAD